MVGIQVPKIKSSTNNKIKDNSYINFDELYVVNHSDPAQGWASPETTFIFKNGDEITLEHDYALYVRKYAQLGLADFNKRKFDEELTGYMAAPKPDDPIWGRTKK